MLYRQLQLHRIEFNCSKEAKTISFMGHIIFFNPGNILEPMKRLDHGHKKVQQVFYISRLKSMEQAGTGNQTLAARGFVTVFDYIELFRSFLSRSTRSGRSKPRQQNDVTFQR